ncbi:Outer membrane protein (OmpH-like) [Rubripirellula amarantea]|uniref:Outer membrane protein (OmpH-like) n=1 Tax=Rubripirellula amarantea TaxID=2527999 RepID=A0A5C5WIG0_9BACT|nr:OmpH family outer membrane protein [Rubripirellula amarantea]TWT50528.1 Outer membrane protein (OmpH-like) [Rubripirellula amarantea]
MRLNAKTATKLALTLGFMVLGAVAPTAAKAQDSNGHRVAVIDVAFIFKNHPGIKSQVAAVESDLKGYEATLNGKRDELKAAAEGLKTFKVGSPEYSAQEEKVASLESKLRLDMARKRKELADAEAQIYFQNYQRIAKTVELIAKHNKVNIVLRYNSENMDLEKGESVIRGVMKNIVYHDDSLDMTKGVMDYLDKVQVANSGTGAARQ